MIFLDFSWSFFNSLTFPWSLRTLRLILNIQIKRYIYKHLKYYAYIIAWNRNEVRTGDMQIRTIHWLIRRKDLFANHLYFTVSWIRRSYKSFQEAQRSSMLQSQRTMVRSKLCESSRDYWETLRYRNAFSCRFPVDLEKKMPWLKRRDETQLLLSRLYLYTYLPFSTWIIRQFIIKISQFHFRLLV